MRLPRRRLLRTAGIVGASALAPGPISGCGADGDALTFFFQANPEEAAGRQRVVAEFARRHPDIKVRTVLSGPDPAQQLLIFCAGGKCPDVLMAWEQTYACLADRGVLLDLNPLLDRDRAFAAQLRAQSIPALYDTFTLSGGQYALPEQWSGNFLFYNRNHIAEAGLTPPDRWSNAWTFPEFLAATQSVGRRDHSGRVTRWGFVDTWVPYYSAGVFGMNNGAQWSIPRTMPARYCFDDPALIEGVQFYADLANRYQVAPTPADAQSISAMDLFTQGRAAFAMGGHWRYRTFSRAERVPLGITALPVGPRGQRARSNIGTTGLAISAASRRREQAWEFVKFATGPVGQAVIAETGLFVPVLRSAITSPGFTAAHATVNNHPILIEGPENSSPLPVSPAWQRVVALMERNFGPVLRGRAPAQTLAGRLTRDANEVLRNQSSVP